MIGALFLRQARKGAEDAGLAQIADVGRVNVLVRRERHDVAVLPAVDEIGQHPDAQQIGRGEEKLGVGMRQACARRHLLADGSKIAIADPAEVERDLGCHGISARSA